MDETRIVREAYGKPAPPTPDEIARARALLLDGPDRLDFAGPSGDAGDDVPLITVGPAAPVPAATRRRFGWWPQIGLGAVAAAAAVVTGITLLSGAPAETERRPAAGPSPKAARDLLLAVAERVERLPATEGRYWYTDQISGQSYIMRPKTGAYAIVGAHIETFTWSGARAGDGTAFHGRDLPARPLTPADEMAWRRAGAPEKFRVWSNDHFWTYVRRSTPWKADDVDPRAGGSFFVRGFGKKVTTEQLRELPTDPAKLTHMFLRTETLRPPKSAEREEKAELARRLKGGFGSLTTAGKLGSMGGMLKNVPVPPKVRAGLIRALIQQPDMRVVGEVTDPLGRRGVAVTADEPRPSTDDADSVYPGEPEEEKGTFGSRREIIIDPRTGALLADQTVLTEPGGPYRAQRPGFVINYWVTRESGWADSRPEPPAKLPF
ncbi:CU044_5270 family protein [Spirillospora sp. NPDC048911]|uniref:CU044_5270 family protein n=1 Tax=Spirillospora sp. NPDC048911 TaxID=3364527 RepID=UPI00372284F7